jgi:3'(2'), 5'-bisphosphate nucleotidase
MNIDIKVLVSIAQKAGEQILKVYNSGDFGIETKKDDSPLTIADQLSDKIITEELLKHYPEIPIVSEEGENVSYETRKDFEYFWLVDPLDGTKEFINKNGDFTVNIALIHKNNPIIGVIYVPVYNTTYHGTLFLGAYKIENGIQSRIQVNNKKDNLTAVGSKSHATDEDKAILSQYDIKDFTSRGSSLKFCMIAEGKADLYHRGGPTMEWDTAAGHAIVLAAGGKVEGLLYNKENLLNSSFTCKGFV